MLLQPSKKKLMQMYVKESFSNRITLSFTNCHKNNFLLFFVKLYHAHSKSFRHFERLFLLPDIKFTLKRKQAQHIQYIDYSGIKMLISSSIECVMLKVEKLLLLSIDTYFLGYKMKIWFFLLFYLVKTF